MKRISKNTNEPGKLKIYRLSATYSGIPISKVDDRWESFKKNKKRKTQVRNQILFDQGGLCAYCEIDLLPATGQAHSDFRIEHFHPKSDTSSGRDWLIEWQNMLGCCHGGSDPKVVDSANRYTSPEFSCDVPKANKNLDGIILNPLNIPAAPAIFKFNRVDGSISVEHKNCIAIGISVIQAQNTIDELNLDAARLKRFRRLVLNSLNQKIFLYVKAGDTIGDARLKLAKIYLSRNSSGNWSPFFSAIRSYLGSEAESYLSSISYTG